MKCKNTLFAFMFMLMLTCNLNAQEASTEKTDAPETALADTLAEAAQELDSVVESDDSASEDEAASDDEVVSEDEAADEGEVDELDEDEDYDELEDDESEEYENLPVSIRVNEDGEFVGQTQAYVSGNWLPVEANVALVSNGVLLSKIVAEQDGSFSFPDIAPGSYTVYGTASSYCGQRAVTVLPERGCCNCGDLNRCDNVGLGLTQDSGGSCYSDLASAPAATFSQGTGFVGGFTGSPIVSSGGFFSGGGIATGGGVASGVSGLRLLAVGGIATAIAVGGGDDDDEVSPTN